MLSEKREYQSTNQESLFHVASSLPEADVQSEDAMFMNAPTRFYSKFVDCMEMYASSQKVADYLNAHQDWFCRCAQPMHVESLGENGYALTIGRFGAFGYEVEPKVGLVLLPLDEGFYRIKTIPVPDYVAPGYEVDFRAAMKLVETLAPDDSPASKEPERQLEGGMTRVEWQLDLIVDIQFPKFIHRLPKSLVQNSGDRLLNQVVRQVSRRLTHKVQEDFHKSLDLSFSLKSKKKRHS